MMTQQEIIDKLMGMTDLECTKWHNGDWLDCCVQHDKDYVEGKGKWRSDWKMAWCVARKGRTRVRHAFVATVMWLGVTFGGWKPYLKYKKERWKMANMIAFNCEVCGGKTYCEEGTPYKCGNDCPSAKKKTVKRIKTVAPTKSEEK